VSQNTTSAFPSTRFFPVRLNDISYTAKVSTRTNRNLLANNTLVQLLALYTDPESHNAQRYK